MKVEKKIISNLTKCYSIAPLHYHEQDYILVAAEKQDPCLLFDCEGNQVDKVWDGPGGTMSMVQVAIFGAVICVMAFTPFLGYIPLGFTRATIIHIPVIIASLLMGPKKGGALGFLFGLTSFINNTMNPTPTSFVFTPFYSIAGVSGGWGSVIICFLPRILVGIIPYYVYKLIIRFSNEKTKKTGVSSIGLVTAGVAGAMTNTLLVMNLIFLFFREAYASANNVAVSGVYTFILSIIGINGVPEAIVAGVLTLCIGRALLKKNVRERLGFRNDIGY